jgi:hypothetical protein
MEQSLQRLLSRDISGRLFLTSDSSPEKYKALQCRGASRVGICPRNNFLTGDGIDVNPCPADDLRAARRPSFVRKKMGSLALFTDAQDGRELVVPLMIALARSRLSTRRSTSAMPQPDLPHVAHSECADFGDLRDLRSISSELSINSPMTKFFNSPPRPARRSLKSIYRQHLSIQR